MLRLKSGVRTGLIGLLVLLLIGAMGMAVLKFIQPKNETKKVPAYQYQQAAMLDYQVFFKSNPFFDQKSAGPGQGYLTPITDYLATDFNYQLDGNNPAKINGQYQVSAAVTGYLLTESHGQRKKLMVWEKVTPLFAPTSFTSDNGKADISEKIPVRLQEFVAFANKVQDEYRAAVDTVELTVTYDVTIEIETPEAQGNDYISSVLIIPIKGNSFTVDGLLTNNKQGSIMTTEVVSTPGLKNARIAYSLTVILLILMLFGVLRKTSVLIEDPLEKELRLITKKYGDRIVTGSGAIPQVFANSKVLVSHFADLIKVADEVAQPILHENLEQNVHNFYVASDPLLYVFTLSSSAFDIPETCDSQPQV